MPPVLNGPPERSAPTPPEPEDIARAVTVVRRHLAVTPLRAYPQLTRAVFGESPATRGNPSTAGSRILLKHENAQLTGAFKVRGGLNLIDRLTASERARGIVAYSTGNHAQSLAYAARGAEVPCTIVMPKGANPGKAQAVRDLDAELVMAGRDMTEAGEAASRLSSTRGMRLVSPADEPDLIAGVATLYVEMLEQEPELDTVVVPVGGGSGAAAACLVAAAHPGIDVIAVQSAQAPAAHDSWHAGTMQQRPIGTRVEGLATGTGYHLTQRIMAGRLADFLLVDDAQIDRAQRMLLDRAHTLVEAAGAAPLAALSADPDRFRGRAIGLVCTGANAGWPEIRRVVAGADAA